MAQLWVLCLDLWGSRHLGGQLSCAIRGSSSSSCVQPMFPVSVLVQEERLRPVPASCVVVHFLFDISYEVEALSSARFPGPSLPTKFVGRYLCSPQPVFPSVRRFLHYFNQPLVCYVLSQHQSQKCNHVDRSLLPPSPGSWSSPPSSQPSRWVVGPSMWAGRGSVPPRIGFPRCRFL